MSHVCSCAGSICLRSWNTMLTWQCHQHTTAVDTDRWGLPSSCLLLQLLAKYTPAVTQIQVVICALPLPCPGMSDSCSHAGVTAAPVGVKADTGSTQLGLSGLAGTSLRRWALLQTGNERECSNKLVMLARASTKPYKCTI